MTDLILIFIAFAAWNLIVFCLYGTDKSRAKQGRGRISEKALLASAFFMGGIGALFGMRIFRHKTKHLKFKIGVPLAAALSIAVIAAIICRKVTYYANFY